MMKLAAENQSQNLNVFFEVTIFTMANIDPTKATTVNHKDSVLKAVYPNLEI